jgi:hypothetical protein
MKKRWIAICVGFMVLFIASESPAEINVIIDFKPLSLLSSGNADGFKVSRSSSYYTSDTIQGWGSWIPQLKLGVGFDLPALYIDLYGGVGYLFNGAFDANMYLGDLAFRFKLGEHVTLGPHVGVVKLDPHWRGSLSTSRDVELGNTTGFMGGLDFTAGGKVVAFSLALDYLNASFDVKTRNGWVANKDKLDISGVALLMGILFRF